VHPTLSYIYLFIILIYYSSCQCPRERVVYLFERTYVLSSYCVSLVLWIFNPIWIHWTRLHSILFYVWRELPHICGVWAHLRRLYQLKFVFMEIHLSSARKRSPYCDAPVLKCVLLRNTERLHQAKPQIRLSRPAQRSLDAQRLRVDLQSTLQLLQGGLH
jgi:hypothetical protein